MKIVRGKDLQFIPASHENPQDPGVYKKILLQRKDLIKGNIQMINWAKLPRGKSFQPHFHEDMEEVFIILNGEVEIKAGGEIEKLSKGDAVLVAVQDVHSMKNISKEDVEYMVIGNSLNKGGKTINL